MPQTDVIPTSASTASTGKGVRYIGEHAYAFSGQVSSGTGGNDAALLDFTSGAGYIVGKFQFSYATDSLDTVDCRYRIKFNGEIVFQYWDTEDIRQGNDPHQYIPLLIPPFTHVETLASANGQFQCSTLTGRVYGAE